MCDKELPYLKTIEEYRLKIANSPRLVIFFSATWCPPCRQIGPVFTALDDDYPDIAFCKIEVDENKDAVRDADICAMPTFKFYKDGKEVDAFTGGKSDVLKNKVEKLKKMQ